MSAYAQHVSVAPHTVTLKAPATGSPDPVASGGAVTLAVEGLDSYDHPLTYSWQASCAGLPSSGTFAPSHAIASPVWTAPTNRTDSEQTCALTATVSDSHGTSTSGTHSQRVLIAPHTIQITTAATGAPNPVPSSGSVTLDVVATDSYDHALSYSWQATCPALPSTGTFTPGPDVKAPTWTAPRNITGTAQACTITVSMGDGHGKTVTSHYSQGVETAAHSISMGTGPTATPNPVASGQAVTLTLAATDSYDHVLTYAWQATCTGLTGTGTFAPSATVASPTWTAPANATGAARTCTLQVTVRDGHDLSQVATLSQTVNTVPDAITITSGPTTSVNPVASGGVTILAVAASDAWNHALTYAWSAACTTLGGNGTFAAPAAATTSWTAPANRTGSTQACTITVTIRDTNGQVQTRTMTQQVASVSNVVSITSGPVAVPNPVASGGTVSLTVGADDLLEGELSYAWSAVCPQSGGNGTMADATKAVARWTAPVNLSGTNQSCTVSVTVGDGRGKTQTGTVGVVVNNALVCQYTLGTIDQKLPAAGGTGSVTVTASDPACRWTATSQSSWLTLTSASGTGTGTATFAAAASTLPGTRIGSITVSGTSVQVPQAGVGYRY